MKKSISPARCFGRVKSALCKKKEGGQPTWRGKCPLGGEARSSCAIYPKEINSPSGIKREGVQHPPRWVQGRMPPPSTEKVYGKKEKEKGLEKPEEKEGTGRRNFPQLPQLKRFPREESQGYGL